MKKVARKIIPLSFLILILGTVSCDNDSDLIADYVSLDDLNEIKSDDYSENTSFETTSDSAMIQEEASDDN